MISEELNGPEYVAVPFSTQEDTVGSQMVIGYISKKHSLLSSIAGRYVEELSRYLREYQGDRGMAGDL